MLCWSSCSALPSSVSCFLARLVGAPLAGGIMELEMVRAMCCVGRPALRCHPVFHAFWLRRLARRWPTESWSWRWWGLCLMLPWTAMMLCVVLPLSAAMLCYQLEMPAAHHLDVQLLPHR